MTASRRQESRHDPAKPWALVNGRLVFPDRIVEGFALIVSGDRITGLAPRESLGYEVERVDAGGRLVTAGLVDIHTHGALGHSFNEPDPAAWETITRENLRRGVTSLAATLAAAPLPDLARCLELARRWKSGAHPGAEILGLHLEGPYLSPAQKGALDPRAIYPPEPESAARLLEYADVLKIVVVAPEVPGVLDFIPRLVERGIVAAAGHSSARDTDLEAAVVRGLRHVTHLWSAQSSTVREGPWRKPGLLEASLVFDGLTVEMIADHKHLPATLMKLAYKCIGPERLSAVSDATSGAGLPEGARFTMGGMEYEVHDGVGMMFDRSAFAGSTTLVNEMIPILTGVVGIPLLEALRMVTLTPARAIGVEGRKGSLTSGKDADVVIWNADWTPERVLQRGRWVEN